MDSQTQMPNPVTILIFHTDGKNALDSISPDNFISCSEVGPNEIVVTSAVPPSPLNPHGIHISKFQVSPHNEHARVLLTWASVRGA